jgi:osmoprotectant transport system ATP-binding protein
MITLDGVTKRYAGGEVAVESLSLEIGDGELCVLVGPSGCGKTTTLRMINRLIEPSGGRILIDGRNVLEMNPVELRRGIGYVIQQGGLFPHRRVGDNVAVVPRLLGWEAPRVDARVKELLGLVGLEPARYARRYPHELSGGERQRVGVARALGGDPPVLLMDEPFGAVDPVTRGRLQQQLIELQDELHKTIVFVTHDIDEAVKLGDRVALLSKGGVLEQFATPEELLAHPQSEFVTGFLGEGPLVRRLALIPISEVELTPVNGAAPEATVDAGGTLRDALDAVLRSADGRVRVINGDRTLGVVDADVIRAASMRSR